LTPNLSILKSNIFSHVHPFKDFFAAGTDTTAIAIEWALAELINHPMVLEKARKEIDNVVKNSRLVQESDVPNLPYIYAIIKETLRLHPPLPMVARKCIEDRRIGSYVIPANSLLFVNVWAIGRDSNYWKNPLDFEPERFLPKEGMGMIDVRGQQFQFLPFGSGRRSCPGINLAMQELPALLAAMIQCFDFKLVGQQGGIMDGENVVVNMDEGPGLTAPRAHDLVCVPMARLSSLDILHL